MKTVMLLLALSGSVWAQDERPERRREPRPEQDGRPPQPPPPPPRPPDAPFNPEEVRTWLQTNEPEVARRLRQLQEDGRREEAQRVLGDAARRMHEMNQLKARDPKAAERMQELQRMERESMELGEQARRAPPEEREAAAKKLKERLDKLFDLREENRARELAELKRRVDGLEKSLTERKVSKDRIVEKRRRELMGESGNDDW